MGDLSVQSGKVIKTLINIWNVNMLALLNANMELSFFWKFWNTKCRVYAKLLQKVLTFICKIKNDKGEQERLKWLKKSLVKLNKSI